MFRNRNVCGVVSFIIQVWADDLATNSCGILEHEPDIAGQGENLAICSGIPEATGDCTSGERHQYPYSLAFFETLPTVHYVSARSALR